jgi:hypothetical protein
VKGIILAGDASVTATEFGVELLDLFDEIRVESVGLKIRVNPVFKNAGIDKREKSVYSVNPD